MKRLIALGISVGVLAGLWTTFALSVPEIRGWASPLVVWIGFAAWATFYAVIEKAIDRTRLADRAVRPHPTTATA